MDSEHASGSSRLPRISEADVDLDDSFEPSTVMDFEHSGGSRTNSEIATSEVAASAIDTSKSFNSLPSSSSENSSHDFFQVNPAMIPMSKTSDHESPPKSEENANSLLKDGKNDVLFQLEELFGSLHSSSQKSDVTDEFVIPILSPTHSPPVQVMERPRGYDPDRIPASVFAKPASPVDWSVASTESLFSIPIGNASFSRDHAFKPVGDINKPNEFGNSGELYVSEEFYKSGELDTFSEQYRCRELQKSSELVRLRQHCPVTKGEHKAQGTDLPNRTIRDEGGINLEAKSFANPIKKKSSKSSCACCSNCCYKCPSCSSCCCKCPGCSSCCCKWPSCSCKWPGCCSCKWPGCCSICCCKSPCCSCKSLSCPSCPWKWSCFPSCC